MTPSRSRKTARRFPEFLSSRLSLDFILNLKIRKPGKEEELPRFGPGGSSTAIPARPSFSLNALLMSVPFLRSPRSLPFCPVHLEFWMRDEQMPDDGLKGFRVWGDVFGVHRGNDHAGGRGCWRVGALPGHRDQPPGADP